MPLKHLAAHYVSKIYWWKTLPLLYGGGVGYSFLREVLGYYETLLKTDPVLVLLAITMLFADYLIGTGKAVWCWFYSDDCRFEIEKQRDAARKLVMWFTTCGICVMLANGFSRVPWPFVEHIAVFDYASLLLCSWVEGASAAKHLGADHYMNRVKRWARGNGTVVTDEEDRG